MSDEAVEYDLTRAANPVRLHIAASAVVIFYDYFLTFGREVDLVWRGKWSLVSALYVVVRYLGLLLVINNIFYTGNIQLSALVSVSSFEDYMYGQIDLTLLGNFADVSGFGRHDFGDLFRIELPWMVCSSTLAGRQALTLRTTVIMIKRVHAITVYFALNLGASALNVGTWKSTPGIYSAISMAIVQSVSFMLVPRLVIKFRNDYEHADRVHLVTGDFEVASDHDLQSLPMAFLPGQADVSSSDME
ncbi:hypothetical protein HYDPIDRAFT_28953 [Hydnomerulius pinastri MD-312]|uniref:DUF6533 domain-containing protein n=1 Tax=Hydnomerulius pinastri MD-312 TaxID=994086 RepID=A0A0C9WFB0_9AGAM|nr:hypothetical protein HYDPIDRAFT_28953 [Hydnomerulius pinastri MD-312]